ncbi:hypothetical protein PHISCL_02618 [Aspergillus sclerotialis]|uniref:Rhodopsin domain-containing protein n=1 Tax=Aspergillus sclerotialis TaxID=2070753 RepID=A0A3A3A4T6_9EURO|nr:hypothetical protein PHISCL_02618 [Aspergillus sclerotialis]
MDYSVSAISMLRVVSLMKIDFNDATYTLPIPLMWSIVQGQLAIVAANIPLLRRVFSRNITRILDGFIPPQAHDALKGS